jgi:RND family efflux transporter MFP subunit
MKKAWIAIIVVAAFGGALAWRIGATVKQDRERKAAMAAAVAERKPVAIRAAPVKRRDLADRVAVSGAIRPNAEVDVFTKMPGRLESVRVKVGDVIRAGQTLAVVEHKEATWQAKQASAAVALARANLAMQQSNMERTRVIQESGNSSPAQITAAETGLQVAQAQLEQALAVEGLAQTALSNATIVAPISGVITKKSCSAGTQATAQAALFQIQDTAVMKLEAGVDARVAAKLRIGLPVEVEVDALSGMSFSGAVSTINPALDPATRRSSVEVVLPNPERRLMANMFARAEIGLGTLSGVLTVPSSAVVEEGGESHVFAIRDGRIAVVNPTILASDGRFIGLKGLGESDMVALEGQKQLATDALVKPVISETN